MPCDPQCRIRQLNGQLITIKEEKIATLQQILDVTEEIGRRDEVMRSKRRIIDKLVELMAEIAYLTAETDRGCNPCQPN